MSYFRVIPTAMEEQQRELESVYRVLCADLAELSAVTRRLSTMTEFDDQIAALRRIQSRGSDQQFSLRQCARTLNNITQRYRETERRCLEDGGIRNAYVTIPRPPAPLWRLQPMVPNAATLLGMQVVVR